jgi:hypothetical protein
MNMFLALFSAIKKGIRPRIKECPQTRIGTHSRRENPIREEVSLRLRDIAPEREDTE